MRLCVVSRFWHEGTGGGVIVAVLCWMGTVEGMWLIRDSQRLRGFTLPELAVATGVLGLLVLMLFAGHSSLVAKTESVPAGTLINAVLAKERELGAEHGVYSTWDSDLGLVNTMGKVVEHPSRNSGEVSLAIGSSGALGVAVLQEGGVCEARRLEPVALGGADKRVQVEDVCSGAEVFGAEEAVISQLGPLRE